MENPITPGEESDTCPANPGLLGDIEHPTTDALLNLSPLKEAVQ